MREGSGFGAATRRETLMMKPFRRKKLQNRWNVVSFYWAWEQYIKCQHFLGNLNFVGYSFHSLWCCCAAPFFSYSRFYFHPETFMNNVYFSKAGKGRCVVVLHAFQKMSWNWQALTLAHFHTINNVCSLLCFLIQCVSFYNTGQSITKLDTWKY